MKKALSVLSEVLVIAAVGAAVIGCLGIMGIFIETLAGKVMPQPNVPGAAIVVWVVETFHFSQVVTWIDNAAMSGLLTVIIITAFAAFQLRKVIRAMVPWVLVLGAAAVATITLAVGPSGVDVNANLAVCAVMMVLSGLLLMQKKPRQYKY